MNTRSLASLSILLLGGAAAAQDLHNGLTMADAVVVGRQVGKRPFNDELVLHKVQVLRSIRGTDAQSITVLDWPNLGLHSRPAPRQSLLYCLCDCSKVAERLGLPASEGPYFKLQGGPGTLPIVGADIDRDPAVKLALVLALAERGRDPAATATDLEAIALSGDPSVRSEATALLIARPDLRLKLSPIDWSQLVQKATGETEDMRYKIALAELCAEQRIPGLVDGLVVSLGPVKDPEFARSVGRIATLLQGEQGAAVITGRLTMMRDPETRAALLLALGASNTDAALQTLLQLRSAGADPAIDAALREHRSPRAQEAAGKRPR
jgi:hypothetical protein